MGSFSPEMLPVIRTLAREFAVYDAWYCGVPSQTFCNRSFFHASTSHGFVTNTAAGGYRKWLDAQRRADHLQPARGGRHPWRVYFDESQLVSLTGCMQRAGAAAVLEDALPHHGGSSTRMSRRQAARLRLHRAAPDLRPQRHAPAGRPSFESHRRRRPQVSIGGGLRRARRRGADARGLHVDPHQRDARRLERHEHACC